jgi:hypothetical protein
VRAITYIILPLSTKYAVITTCHGCTLAYRSLISFDAGKDLTQRLSQRATHGLKTHRCCVHIGSTSHEPSRPFPTQVFLAREIYYCGGHLMPLLLCCSLRGAMNSSAHGLCEGRSTSTSIQSMNSTVWAHRLSSPAPVFTTHMHAARY